MEFVLSNEEINKQRQKEGKKTGKTNYEENKHIDVKRT
jgi:hypothetical protein